MSENKTPFAMTLDALTWLPVEPPAETTDGLPYVTHQGELHILGKTMMCYRLSNGQAVFNADDFEAFWEGLGDAPVDTEKGGE